MLGKENCPDLSMHTSSLYGEEEGRVRGEEGGRRGGGGGGKRVKDDNLCNNHHYVEANFNLSLLTT